MQHSIEVANLRDSFRRTGNLHFMAGSSKDKRTGKSANQTEASAMAKMSKRDAEWTEGLKKLYDSVVDEPLPDTFQELLSKLDAED